MKLKNAFKPTGNVKFSDTPNQSAGVRDDHAVRKNVASREGSVEHVPTEENHIVNKKYVDSIASKQVVELFLTTNASDIADYDDLDIDVSPDAETEITKTITAGSTTLINVFASKLDEAEIDALEILESGIYDLHVHASATKNTGMTVYYEFYHRTALGVETLLGTSHDSTVLTLVDAKYDDHAYITEEKVFVAGDRIVIKVYGRNTGGADKNITLYMEGGTSSRVEFPGFVSPAFVPAHTHSTEKQYLGDGTDFTVTGTNWTTTRAVAIPYQTSDGAWRMKFNLAGTIAGGDVDTKILTLSGVTFKNGYNQAVALSHNTSTTIRWLSAANTLSNSGVINCFFGGGGIGEVFASGDVELESKPTWAD